MADKEKKYFWLKLPRNFFEKHYIKILRGMEREEYPGNTFGELLVVFYIWLLAECIDHEGRLRYSETKPYDADLLAAASGYALQFVTQALQIFAKLELVVTESDGTLFLPKSLKMIGSESASAKRVREYRQRQEEAKNNPEMSENTGNFANRYNVTQSNNMKQNGNTEKELEKEKELELDVNITVSNDTVCQTNVQRIVDEWNTLQSFGIKPISKLSSNSKRYRNLIARIKQYGVEDILKAIDRIKISNYCQGKNRHGWIITFDWFVLPNNFPKVFEGNYDNRNGQGVQNQYNGFLSS